MSGNPFIIKCLQFQTQRFHILVALMLSSQTKDNVTYEAMLRLRSNGLTPRSLVECELGDLEQKLYPVSFYKVTIYIVYRNIIIDFQILF